MDYIANTNDMWTHNHAFEKVNQGSNHIKFGQVVKVQRKNHLGMTYKVQVFDTDNLILENCKLVSSDSGFNGAGNFQPLNEGTPVVLAFKNGITADAIIIGCFSTEGNYDDFYQKGNLQKPEQLEEASEFNQPSGHPNRITQEDSHFHIVGGKTIQSFYDSPEFHVEDKDKIAARPMPSSIEMKNQGGDVVQYSLGANVTYSDGNIVQVSGGDREQKSTKLLRFASMHLRRAELIQGPSPLTALKASEQKLPSGILPVVGTTKKVDSNSTEAIPDSYRVEQEKKLADLYAQAAQNQNQLTTSRLTEAQRLQKTHGSELGAPVDPTRTTPHWNPKREQARVASSNFGDRSSKDINGKDISNKLLVVIHETVGDAQSSLNVFANPASQASYHAMIKRDGTIVNIVAPNKRAYGAAQSTFKGENVKLSSAAASVNNFAYHISLESPLDGRGNSTTHSGYTDAQYQSLALLTSQTGVEPNRITTHKQVDGTGERSDPRSFNTDKFNHLLSAYPSKRVMDFGPGIK